MRKSPKIYNALYKEDGQNLVTPVTLTTVTFEEAWSIRRDVGHDLNRRTDVPVQQLQCPSRQGAGTQFGWDIPIYLYSGY